MRVPDDLLGYLIGPTPYSSTWLGVAAALVAAIVLWYAAVFWWTAPGRQHREPSVIGSARVALLRRRALRRIDEAEKRFGAGDLAAAAAGAAMNLEVRRFLHGATGVRAEYLQVPDLAAVSGGTLAPAVPVLSDLEDVQFNADSTVDIGAAGRAAAELVRQWT